MTYPRALIVLAVIVAVFVVLVVIVEPASQLDIPNNRPAKYYPTQSAEPAQDP